MLQPAMEPAALRALLESRGPVFVKLGQFMALRQDVLEYRYSVELLKLADRGPIMAWPRVEKILTDDLGQPPAKLFRVIDRHPWAAASLAQVHLATTDDGHEVAVKVQREGVRADVERALAEPHAIYSLWKATGMTALASPDELMSEFRRWLEEELDFRNELGNLKRLNALARDYKSFRVPRPYEILSGERVVTQSYLRGVPFTEILSDGGPGSDDADTLAPYGLDRDVLARRLITSVFTQIFEFGFFHADPHPGNLIALERNVVGFVDLGLADVLDETFRAGMVRYLSAIYRGDMSDMYRGLNELLLGDENSDRDGFHEDFVALSHQWAKDRDDTAPVSGRSPIASYLIGVLDAARRHGLRPPPSLLSMYRALLTAETVANRLSPRADLRRVGRRFFARLRWDALRRQFDRERYATLAMDAADFMEHAPKQLRQLLSDLEENRFVLKVRSLSSAEDRRRSDARARLIALAVTEVTLAVLIVGSEWIAHGTYGDVMQAVGGVLFAAVAAAAWLQWRRLG